MNIIIIIILGQACKLILGISTGCTGDGLQKTNSDNLERV